MALDPSKKARLTERALPLFAGPTLFDRVARTACRAGCLPRKELYECWEVARRVRRRFRGGRVVDLCAGHGLLAHLMLILDDTSPEAVAVDPRRPPSSEKLAEAFALEWPRLQGRVSFVERPLQEFDLRADDVVVSAHACGGLTDLVLARAASARARVAVLPCCHDLKQGDDAGLRGWMDGTLAMDAARAFALRAAGYAVWTQTIPGEITEKNRLLVGSPADDLGR